MELVSKRIFLFDGFNRFQSRPCLSQQMLDCLPRSVNQHPGTGKAHHPSHLFPHGGFVAVYAALLACFLFLPEGTVVQAGVCIVQQLFAPGAKRDILFFFTDQYGFCSILISVRIDAKVTKISKKPYLCTPKK